MAAIAELIDSAWKRAKSFRTARMEANSELQRLEIGLLVERLPRLGVFFLNFDSALDITRQKTAAIHPELEALLRRHSEVDVILTVTWRGGELRGLKSMFSDDLRWRVIGITPDLEKQDGSRLDEIRHIVSAYHIHNWVALDDQQHLYPPGTDANFIPVDPRRGVTRAEIAKLDDKMSAWSR